MSQNRKNAKIVSLLLLAWGLVSLGVGVKCLMDGRISLAVTGTMGLVGAFQLASGLMGNKGATVPSKMSGFMPIFMLGILVDAGLWAAIHFTNTSSVDMLPLIVFSGAALLSLAMYFTARSVVDEALDK